MNRTLENQTIALGGISQAAFLVQQIARRGVADQDALAASIGSVLKIDADDMPAVYGGLAGVAVGLRQLERQLNGRRTMDAEQARYAAALIFLERKMMQQPKILQDIRIGVERVMAQAETLPITHGNILANLGDLYHNTISTIQPRVMVNGEPVFLTQPENVNKIRALLLAGIRSCVLWRQCGGRRWKILLFRRQILDQTRNLLKRL